jgi:hypothetical protein
MPHWNAAMLLPLMIILNLIVIVAPFKITSSISSFVDLRIAGLVIQGSLIELNYFLFIRTKKYKEFEEAFDSLDKQGQRKNYFVGIFISIFGYVFPIVTLILMLKFS